MHCQLVLQDFGPNIQYIAGVDNIVADTISRFPSTYIYQYDTITIRYLSQVDDLLTTRLEQTTEDGYPLYLSLVQ